MLSNDVAIQKRIDMDLLKRSLTGVFVYAIMLPAVFWPFEFHLLQPSLSFTFAASMLFVSILRLIHKYFTTRLYAYSVKLWRGLFMCLSLSHACILSTFFVFAIYDERFSPVLHVSMLAIGGICSGSVVALIPRGKFALLNLSVLVVPSIIAGLLMSNKLPYVGMLTAYFGYIAMIGARSSREYIRAFEIELVLEKQKKSIEMQSKIDALTNIYNRGYFNIELEKQWEYAKRFKLKLSLLLIDVDHFKVFNDNHGHLLGDACLVHIANVITQVGKRKTDFIARFGGEEFVVLVPEKEDEIASTLGENIRQQIAETPFEVDGKSFPVTVSVGVVSILPEGKLDSRQLIEQADIALYQAKNNGRNCVKIYQA